VCRPDHLWNAHPKLVFGHDHFRLLTDTGFKLNRRALDRRIDLAIATFCAVEDRAGATQAGGEHP